MLYALSDAGYALWGIVVTQIVTLVGLVINSQRNRHQTNIIKDKVDAASDASPSQNDLELVRNDIKLLASAITDISRTESLWRQMLDQRLNGIDEHITRLYAITGARRAVEQRNRED